MFSPHRKLCCLSSLCYLIKSFNIQGCSNKQGRGQQFSKLTEILRIGTKLAFYTGTPFPVTSVHCMKSDQIQSYFWSVFSGIQTEYGEILRISRCSVRMRENTDQKNSEYEHFLRSVQKSYIKARKTSFSRTEVESRSCSHMFCR